MTTDHVQIPPSDNVPPEANRFIQMLNWAYDAALEGFTGFDGARVIAAGAKGNTPAERANNVINWESAKAASVGALTGIGGFITMPVTLPANLAGTALVQLRMVQSVAILAGHDPKDERVRTMALLALLGMSATEVLKQIGLTVTRALAEQFVKDVVVQALTKAIVKGAIAKTAGKSIISSVSRLVPVISAFIGAGLDAAATKITGEIAYKVFMPVPEPEPTEIPA